MKLDMGKAWNDAMALLQGNLGLVATIIALFYFLPSFAVALLFPELANAQPPEIPPGTEPDRALEILSGFFQEMYARSWPFLLFITVAQYAGALAVLALFSDRGNPTVGEALKTGLRAAPSYIGAVLLYSLGFGIAVGAIVGLTFALLPLLGALLMLVAAVLLVYVIIKFTLVPTVIGMEGELNPISALKRSWTLTKGNSLRIFAFLIVLLLTIGLVGLVATMVIGTVFAVFGEPVAGIGTSFFEALVSSVMGGIFLVVLAAIHKQLAGSGQAQADTFE